MVGWLRPWSTLWLVWPRGLLWPFMLEFWKSLPKPRLCRGMTAATLSAYLFHWSTGPLIFDWTIGTLIEQVPAIKDPKVVTQTLQEEERAAWFGLTIVPFPVAVLDHLDLKFKRVVALIGSREINLLEKLELFGSNSDSGSIEINGER